MGQQPYASQRIVRRAGDEEPHEVIMEPRRYDDDDDQEPVQGSRPRQAFGTLSVADFEDASRTTSVTLDIQGGRKGVLTVEYDPSMVNDAASGLMQELADDDDRLAAAEVFCKMVLSWGMMGPLTGMVIQRNDADEIMRTKTGTVLVAKEIIVPEGEPVPLEPEVIQYLRSDIMMGVWRHITEEVAGTGKARKGSQNKSRRHSSTRRFTGSR